MEEFVEIFVKNECNEIPSENAEYIDKFRPFYSNISSDYLAYIFSYLHYRYNSLFDFLNDKMTINRHYNADASRSLISAINLYRKLDKNLKDTKYEFEIDKEYSKIIDGCETFLCNSGGSAIPDDFEKVDVIEIKPIFKLIGSLHTTVNTETIQKHKNQDASMKKNISKVFIVHGHDNEAKQEVARFIESIGLQTIILHEQASRSMTIIEKIEHYANEASFAVVLYTPCDKGRGSNETSVPARNRARQNVVFEHGYLMARIGRKNVFALVKGEIETPSDISGVVYTPLDSHGGWKQELTKELKDCGYKIE